MSEPNTAEFRQLRDGLLEKLYELRDIAHRLAADRARQRLNEPQFTLQEAAAVADVPYDQFRQWVARGIFIPQDPNPPGRGRRRLVSMDDVLGLAFLKVLSDLNQPLNHFSAFRLMVSARAFHILEAGGHQDLTVYLYPDPTNEIGQSLFRTDNATTSEQLAEQLKGKFGVIVIQFDALIVATIERLVALLNEPESGREAVLGDLMPIDSGLRDPEVKDPPENPASIEDDPK